MDKNFYCACGAVYTHQELAGQRLRWGMNDDCTRFILNWCVACHAPVEERRAVDQLYRPPDSRTPIPLSGLATDMHGRPWGSQSGKVGCVAAIEPDSNDAVWDDDSDGVWD